MTTVSVNPTYDPFWRILANELFFQNTGISLGYGHRQFYNQNTIDDSDSITPFKAHATPEHGVQLVLARWLKYFVVNQTEWNAPETENRLSSAKAWERLLAVLESSQDLSSGDLPPLPSVDFSPCSLMKFLIRWYGHAIASRAKTRGMKPKLAVKHQAQLATILNHLLSISSPHPNTLPTKQLLQRVTNLDVTILPTKKRKNKREIVNCPRIPSEENDSLWQIMPPALDDFELEKEFLSKKMKIEFIIPTSPSHVCIDPRGTSLRIDPLSMYSNYRNWWNRPSAKLVIQYLLRTIDIWGLQDPFAISQTIQNIIPFMNQYELDTIITKWLSKSEDVQTVATGKSDATVRFEPSRTRPLYFPSNFRIIGIQRKTIAFVPTIHPNLGRAYHIQSKSYESMCDSWIAIKELAKEILNIVSWVDVCKSENFDTDHSFYLCFKTETDPHWKSSHLIQRRKKQKQSQSIEIETRAKLKRIDLFSLDPTDCKTESVTDCVYATLLIPPKIQRCLLSTQKGLRIAERLHDMCISDHVYYRWSTKEAKYVLNAISQAKGCSDNDILVIIPWEKAKKIMEEDFLSFLKEPQPSDFYSVRENVKAFEKKGVQYPALKVFDFSENNQQIRESILVGLALSPWHISLMDQFAPINTMKTIKTIIELPFFQNYPSLKAWVRTKVNRLFCEDSVETS